LFSSEIRKRSIVSKVDFTHNMIWMNRPDGFEYKVLPSEAQLSPIYAITVEDLNRDGRPDIITGGNQSVGKPEIGINAASFGTILINAKPNDRGWKFVPYGPAKTGMILDGDVRKIIRINNKKFAVARSNGTLLELQFD
jgi:hypothetical protein